MLKNDPRIGQKTAPVGLPMSAYRPVLLVALAVAGGLLGVSSCGSGDEAQETATTSVTTTSVALPVAVEVTEDVPVTSTRTLDIYEPVEGGPWPVVVLWHGQPLGLDAPEDFRQELAPLAEAIAEQGAVVFNASYSATSPSVLINETTCSAQVAVEQAVEHGGDPDRLVMVGHSFGAAPAMVYGLDSPTRTRPFEDCRAEAASFEAMPSVAVGVEAGLDPRPIVPIGPDEEWRTLDDSALDEISPIDLVGGNPGLQVYFAPGPALLGQFAKPEDSVALHEALTQAGYESTVIEPQLSGPHGAGVRPEGPDFDRVVAFINSAVAAVN